MHRTVLFLTAIIAIQTASYSQETTKKTPKLHCGTLPRLELKFNENPSLKSRFATDKKVFNAMVKSGSHRTTAVPPVVIPIVFHIVLRDPSMVTDAQIQAQLDVLNQDFGGLNADSVRIPAYFKSLFGKSGIQFCLARRTPDGDITNGIERTQTVRNSFTYDDKVKHAIDGGADAWNTSKYLNIWIASLSDDLLGYASFPNDGLPIEQGVVVDYRTVPGGSSAEYGGGKTLTHETGHFFNLNHIWGDDDGTCTGTDEVDDTPNQGDATGGAPIGVKTDLCTNDAKGIMYQNYMDYTNDECLVMFTTEQVQRMEAALTNYRSSFYSSDGCVPVPATVYNAQLRSITLPSQRLCTPAFTPVVVLRNKGTQNLTNAKITVQIDNLTPVVNNWTGNLATTASASVSLNSMTTGPGTHTIKIYTSLPNGQNDEEKSNDTLTAVYQYTDPVSSLSQGFEVSTFPPVGWDIVNPDNLTTWSRVSGMGKTGFASIMINNSDYSEIGQRDDLRLPLVSIGNDADSAFLSFQVAAATYSPLNTPNNLWDTLEVLVSKDCGQTYTSVYKKWASTLVTRTSPVLTGFTPSPSEWRKDSISLQNFIGAGTLLITIRNTTGFENNIYLDDINLRTVNVNPNLKEKGFLVTPSPTSGKIAVQFYPVPADLKLVQVFTATGQLVAETKAGSGSSATMYEFNLSTQAAGIYTVRAVFADRVLVKKVVKMND